MHPVKPASTQERACFFIIGKSKDLKLIPLERAVTGLLRPITDAKPNKTCYLSKK